MLRLALALSTLAVFFGGIFTEKGGATNNARVICNVVGRYCSEAVRVASCESGMDIYARNGQYLGLFQMGSYARARYGHSWNAWGQARAAYHYFRDAGFNWSPWTCGWAARGG